MTDIGDKQFSIPGQTYKGRKSRIFIDNFSTGLDDMKRSDQRDMMKVFAVVAREGKFSTFEASANNTIAGTMTALMRSGLLESYTPESYKAKPEPGGAKGPDQDTYPWTFVRLTDAGRKALGKTE